jgi:hypothetical protein
MERLLELFVHVDDFCQAFLPHLEQHLISSGAIQRNLRQGKELHLEYWPDFDQVLKSDKIYPLAIVLGELHSCPPPTGLKNPAG